MDTFSGSISTLYTDFIVFINIKHYLKFAPFLCLAHETFIRASTPSPVSLDPVLVDAGTDLEKKFGGSDQKI